MLVKDTVCKCGSKAPRFQGRSMSASSVGVFDWYRPIADSQIIRAWASPPTSCSGSV